MRPIGADVAQLERGVGAPVRAADPFVIRLPNQERAKLGRRVQIARASPRAAIAVSVGRAKKERHLAGHAGAIFDRLLRNARLAIEILLFDEWQEVRQPTPRR